MFIVTTVENGTFKNSSMGHLHTNTKPTIGDYNDFHETKDAAAIYKAMKGWGTNEKAILSILTRRSLKQRMEIVEEYQKRYKKNMIKELKSEIRGKLGELLLSLFHNKAEFYASEIHGAIAGYGTDELALTERIKRIQKDLKTEVMADVSGEFENLLSALMQDKRRRSGPHNKDVQSTTAVAKKLVKAGVGIWLGTDEKKFVEIFSEASYSELAEISKEYEKLTNLTLIDSLKTETSGDFQNLLVYIVQYAENPINHYARILQNALQKGSRFKGRNSYRTVIRVLVERSEIDLGDIVDRYALIADNSLESDWLMALATLLTSLLNLSCGDLQTNNVMAGPGSTLTMRELRFNQILEFLKQPFDPQVEDLVSYYNTLWHSWNDLSVAFSYGLEWKLPLALQAIQSVVDSFPPYLEQMEMELQRPRHAANYKKTPTDCMSKAMNCSMNILSSMSRDLKPGSGAIGLDGEYLKEFDVRFHNLVNNLIDNFANCSSALNEAMIDVFAAIGSHLYSRLPEKVEQRIAPFLLSVAQADSTDVSFRVKSRVGRCLEKYVEFPIFRTNFLFLMDVFELCERFLLESNHEVRISYASTFASWTDVIVADYDSDVFENNALNIRILSTLVVCLELLAEAKYNVGRACGNIISWIPLRLLEINEVKTSVCIIVKALVSEIGTGDDARWICSEAVGNILRNRMFFEQLKEPVTDPIIMQLSNGMVDSLNLKERTHCVRSLRKVKDKEIYGTRYVVVWNHLCFTLAALPPTEKSEEIKNLKSECCLLFFHLIIMLEPEDFPSINDAIVENMQHLRSLVEATVPAIGMEQMNEAMIAVDYIKDVSQRLEMRTHERTVFALGEIVQLAIEIHRAARRKGVPST
ncbi:Annexin B9 [Orchesella cincta]|uniref:Annexin n=1 Tax=Orchesella cincta TaxID=48709 RepID=A0A1D2MIQ5_ORCCI|nr:Annexin B9 [Orchesella cincta]